VSEKNRRVRGLIALVGAAVENGASAVERVHRATARNTFAVLEQIPVIAAPATLVDEIFGAALTGAYGSVRLVTRIVQRTLDGVLAAVDDNGDELGEGDAEHDADSDADSDL
jgi:hypothetical protein